MKQLIPLSPGIAPLIRTLSPKVGCSGSCVEEAPFGSTRETSDRRFLEECAGRKWFDEGEASSEPDGFVEG